MNCYKKTRLYFRGQQKKHKEMSQIIIDNFNQKSLLGYKPMRLECYLSR